MEPSSFTELALLRQGRGWRFRTSLNELSSRKYLDRNVKEASEPVGVEVPGYGREEERGDRDVEPDGDG
ncbi:hypothetical protein Q3G72_001991 [Acer saccharum]|nr:hypothetical protein Q3G72_001991 [Acer saccharum]